MSSANVDKVSGVNSPSSANQQDSNSIGKPASVPAFDRQKAMKHLAEMSMPVDTHTMIANVDSVMTNAMKTINDSLKQSSNYIDAARQQLMQDHPALNQAYVSEFSKGTHSAGITSNDNDTQEKANEKSAQVIKSANGLDQNALHELQHDSSDYQNKIMSAHEAQQKQAMAKQNTISKAANEMQKQLMAQQQAYQQHVLTAAFNETASMAKQTEKVVKQDHETIGQDTAQLHEKDGNPSVAHSPSSQLHAHQEE